MTIHEYLEEGIFLLTVSSIVKGFQIITRKETGTDGYLRIRVTLIDEGLLEISIYCQLAEDTIYLVDYRFHWQDKEGKLKMRWDNARHHPELKTFPHHMHMGEDGNVKASTGIDLWGVLRIMESEVKEEKWGS